MSSSGADATRIGELVAIEDIRRLKHRYMSFCDLGYPSDKIGPMFVDDAVWDGGEAFGRHEGRPAIEAFFDGVSSTIVFAAHLALNAIIEVDGDRATAKWRMIMPCTLVVEGVKSSRWILGDYVDACVRRDGTWMFQSVDFLVNFNVATDESWIDSAIVRG